MKPEIHSRKRRKIAVPARYAILPATLAEVCDGSVVLADAILDDLSDSVFRPAAETPPKPRRRAPVTLDTVLPAPLFSHLVLLITENADVNAVRAFWPALQARATTAVLMSLTANKDLMQETSAVGTLIETPRHVRTLLDRPELAAARRVVYLQPRALTETLMAPLRELITATPQTQFVFASFAAGFWNAAVLMVRQRPNVWVDTAALSARRMHSVFANRYQLSRSLNGLADRVIFASGYPLGEPIKLLEILTSWIADERDRRKFLTENGQSVYFPTAEDADKSC